jgi:hypothetical protein
MLGYLNIAHSLPSTFGPNSTQQLTFTINPSVLDNLGTADRLQQLPDAKNTELGIEVRRHEPAGIIV